MRLTFENIRTGRRRKVFSIWGTDCLVTPYAGLSVLFFLLLGAVVAIARGDDQEIVTFLRSGVSIGLVLFASNIAHSAGHILAGAFLNSPGRAVLITATFHINFHKCESTTCTRWSHLGRAAAGPAANLLLGCVALYLHHKFGPDWLDFMAKANLIIGAWFLLPVPSFDGRIIWGELLRLRHPSQN